MNSWEQKLTYSFGVRQRTDIETLRALIPGCTGVVKTNRDADKKGVDYIATLRRGAEILIDAKSREAGASRYWQHGDPELALEIYSVKPVPGIHSGKVGWTLNEASDVDMIFYTFAQRDTDNVYLLPFQHLRMAFIQNFSAWSRTYRRKEQETEKGRLYWRSECIFVPADAVLRAIDSVSRCNVMRDMFTLPSTAGEHEPSAINHEDFDYEVDATAHAERYLKSAD